MKNIFFYDKGIKQQGPNDFVVWLPRLHNIHELYKELGKVFHFSDDSCGSWDAFREQFYYLNVDEIEQCNIHIYHESIAKIIPTWDLAMYLSVINEFITEHMQDISSHQLFFYFNIKEADTIAKYWPGKLVIEESWGGENVIVFRQRMISRTDPVILSSMQFCIEKSSCHLDCKINDLP